MINIHTLKTKPYESIKNQNKKFGSFGIYSLDNALDGIVSGTVTVITGRPSEGKSTFLHGVILKNIDYQK
jgi:predicted ATP-dependent serine protease